MFILAYETPSDWCHGYSIKQWWIFMDYLLVLHFSDQLAVGWWHVLVLWWNANFLILIPHLWRSLLAPQTFASPSIIYFRTQFALTLWYNSTTTGCTNFVTAEHQQISECFCKCLDELIYSLLIIISNCNWWVVTWVRFLFLKYFTERCTLMLTADSPHTFFSWMWLKNNEHVS